jgi:selenide,water dikinase
MQSVPVIKDVVLLGGGHSHIAVLKSFGMRPVPGARLTLISRDIETPYSGMLPGLIAGHYTADEAHIDLLPLTRFANARFFQADVTGIDPSAQTVLLKGRPPVSFDLLSINTGSTPSTHQVPGAEDNVVPVKPINRFLPHWKLLQKRIEAHEGRINIGIVGGGVGGVELSLAIHHAISRSLNILNNIRLELVTADEEILSEQPSGVAQRFRRLLAEREIAVHTATEIIGVEPGTLFDSSGREFVYDEILWATQASAPAWLSETGLELDDDGFMLVNENLQSLSQTNIFGAGDIATMINTPRPKAGVFAVRQGPPLIRNLRSSLLGRSLSSYHPQKSILKLISTGDQCAVASRGIWSAEGRWVWRWKDWIDSRFIRKYQQLPEIAMGKMNLVVSPELLDSAPEKPPKDLIRCGGCGAKVGADVLTTALKDLPIISKNSVIVGLDQPDDAALISVPPGKLSVLSVDAFRPMIPDPYLFGQITANHCLGDLYAMGAEPQTAMTLATLPTWPEKKLIDELRQMLLGALQVFNSEGAALVGGHTSEGIELSLGFSVTGLIEPDQTLRKTTPREGDVLLVTKAMGTGSLLAADMRAKAKGHWIEKAVISMLLSNRAAGNLLGSHGASACTDVTGFGLVGHLLEMLRGSSLGAIIDMSALPVLDGTLQTLSAGLVSTLQPKNERFSQQIENTDEVRQNPMFQLLFDPQTSGGLLASISADKAQRCLKDLIAQGYQSSVIIGRVVATQSVQKICIKI